MKKVFASIIIIFSFMMILSQNVLAKEGEWKQSDDKWWYEYSDGTYPTDEWVEIDGNGIILMLVVGCKMAGFIQEVIITI